MKKFAIFLCFFAYINALELNQNIPHIKILDQFDNSITLDENISKIIYVDSKDKSDVLKDFLKSKKPEFLSSHKTIYLADISDMPSIIASLIALPRMRDLKYPIYLLDEKYIKLFANKKEKITIYSFSDSKVQDIKYLTTKEELSEYFGK